uniref:tRNA pseudouridine(55) synthase n=1 Tax=Pseudictyota dubia TaxID=2749911 RepID=A0A7R9WF28_9STRA|mmetsp:Transcript_46594/g.86554  ORF Transcript_46594/g.86554 Transcript_46594/m.86554 type:complete len:448 (+) Transcript_46594:25-1368(+)
MGQRCMIAPLLLTVVLLSTTTITTTVAFLLPRVFGGGGSGIAAPSVARARLSPLSSSAKAAYFARTSSDRGLALLVGARGPSTASFGLGMVAGRSDGVVRRGGRKKRSLSATASSSPAGGAENAGGGGTEQAATPEPEPPLYLEEGLFAVRKPLGWTSQDVVGKLRFLLEADARSRNAPDRRKKRRKPWMKLGHGGTLDPLATGVLVCGVGRGTKDLQKYLVGSKAYRAEVTLGYRTTTLDADPKGEVVEEKTFDHVTSMKAIDDVLRSKFTGKIQQIPPVFSALKRDGKKLYELGRKGQTAEDLKIEPREVTIYDLKLVGYEGGGDDEESKPKPIQRFVIDVECGGGTYVRSLVRDIGVALGTVATMTRLERTKQGRFLLEHSLPYSSPSSSSADTEEDDVRYDEEGAVVIDKREDCNWTVDTINEAIRTCRDTVLASDDDGLRDK